MKFILKYFILLSTLNSDCLDSDALKGMGFTNTKSSPEIQDQDVCSEQIKKHGSCVDVSELKTLMEKQQEELVNGLEVDDEIDNVLGSYQDGLEGTTLEDEFVQVREKYKENKSKCGNKLAKVNQGVLCLVASGQASQYTQVSGTEITVDVNSTEIEESNQSCEPVVEAICLAGTGQSIEKDLVADDTELNGDNDGLQNTCSNIKKNKKNLVENFNTQKIKKVMPKKEEIKKIKEKVEEKKDTIKDKIKDKKGGEKIAKSNTEKSDDFEKEFEKEEKQKDGSVPESDKQKDQMKPQSDTQQKPQSDSQQKPQQDTQQKPQSDTQQKPQSDTQQKPQSDTQQKPQSDTQKSTDKKYRRLSTSNGAPVVTIATTSGVEDAYENSHLNYIIFLSLIIFIQIN